MLPTASRWIVPLAIVLTGAPAASQSRQPPADRRNFVTCPIVRDTKTVPCWLAEFQGELYFLGIQVDTGAEWYPPQLGHEVLVEGAVSSGPRVCGGIPLKPINTSVMPELNGACNTILPAEEGIEAPHSERGPGPSSERRSAAPRVPAPIEPSPPFTTRTFTIPFDFDNDFMPGRVTRIVDGAVRYAKATSAARVEVTAYRGATLLSNGKTLVESPLIAERRARKLEAILHGLGLPATSVVTTWKRVAEPADGIKDPETRRATIVVRPGGANRDDK
jgi:hypothetical protein